MTATPPRLPPPVGRCLVCFEMTTDRAVKRLDGFPFLFCHHGECEAIYLLEPFDAFARFCKRDQLREPE